VLSRPSVVARNNQPAIDHRGPSVPLILGGTLDNFGNQINSAHTRAWNHPGGLLRATTDGRESTFAFPVAAMARKVTW